MKYILLNLLAAIMIGVFFTGCSELKDDLTRPGEVMFHKQGINDPHSENFHGILVRENNWNLKICSQCHASDFSGGAVGVSCLSCHTAQGGPQSCNTCHGNFADPSRIAPPTDLSNRFETTERTVGAHAKHLYDNVLGNKVKCSNCHNMPQGIYDPVHMDGDDQAEVNLKELATAFGADNAVYNRENATCSNTYCHGNFEFYRDSAVATNRFAYTSDKMTGLNKTVVWTKVAQNEAECGSCHALPPAGHINNPPMTVKDCYQCHLEVVDPAGNIIDKSKHINGEINARF